MVRRGCLFHGFAVLTLYFEVQPEEDQRLGKHPGSWLCKQLSPVLGGRLLRMQSSSTLLKSRRERQRLLQLLQSQATAVITAMKVTDSYRRWVFVAPMCYSWRVLTPSLSSRVFLLVVLEQLNLPLLVTQHFSSSSTVPART